MKTFKQVKAAIQQLPSMRVTKTSEGEFRVNYRQGRESTAYYTDNAQDAINTAIRMYKANIDLWKLS